jgi:hypothetical protein
MLHLPWDDYSAVMLSEASFVENKKRSGAHLWSSHIIPAPPHAISLKLLLLVFTAVLFQLENHIRDGLR